jgi:beta-mannosidase
MGHNWGSLYWQLDDCWPVASWSGIDYYGRWKALHYAARRFFAPVLVSPVEAKGGAKGGDNIEVWAISDRRADARVRLTVRVLDLAGGEIMRREADVTLAANASRAYLTLSRAEALKGAKPEQAVLVAELSERGKSLGRNILTFVTTKEMALPAPEIATEVEPQRDGAFAIKVTSRRFARAVYLTAGPEGFFDDNYFDLLPGESRVVSFRPQGAAPTAEALRATLRVTSIADSY